MNHLFQKIAYKCINDMGSFIGFSIICISYTCNTYDVRCSCPFATDFTFSSPNVS